MSSTVQSSGLAAARKSAQSISDLLDKIASAKKADTLTENTAIGGSSSHPTATAEDETRKPSEGPRLAENDADVTEFIGPASVSASRDQVGGDQIAGEPNIGQQQSIVGTEPSLETASVETTKTDTSIGGPTSHPARTDNNELNGGKYASARSEIKAASGAGSALLARMLVKNANENPRSPSAAAPAAQRDKTAGAAAASLVTTPTLRAQTLDVVKAAAAQAALVADYLDSREATLAHLRKAAEETSESDAGASDDEKKKKDGDDSGGGESSDGSESSGGGDSSGGGGSPDFGGGPPPSDPGASPMGGGGEGLSPEDMVALLTGQGGAAGGGGMGGGAPPMDAGGPPPMDAGGGMPMGGSGPPIDPAAMGGGAPPMDAMGGGAPPMDAGGGMPMGGGAPEGSPDEQTAMLAEALARLGISPEQFQAAAAGKMASAIHGPKLTPGTFYRPKTAADGQRLQQAISYVTEIMGK